MSGCLYKTWGDNIADNAKEQMDLAASLPIAEKAALMPDAHLGYGLPIGGVLAVKNAIIPNAVGVDIACRMRMSILPIDDTFFGDFFDLFIDALKDQTHFGVGRSVTKNPYDHSVLDDPLWEDIEILKNGKERARAQLGTSGSGNHFVEFGSIANKVAVLSHSGSRGIGHKVATHYSRIAKEKCKDILPKKLLPLSWLTLDSTVGDEYHKVMCLMGEYASANHEIIHDNILGSLGVKADRTIENHHNFAWTERHDNSTYIVHRKGATPAQKYKEAIIPGSMATPSFVVRGKGNPDSLMSASHGAGRVMSRKEAKAQITKKSMLEFLEKHGVYAINLEVDEAPMAYKDIYEVMNSQKDLVEITDVFHPKIVMMAGD